jgi:phosphatidylinositol-3,4,5-trisphosphate 3-phosphatase/dual-specificity protein phosphatase PTEN
MHPPSGWQKPIASLLLGSGGSGNGKAWASVARYDDEYVAELRRRGGAGEGVTSEISWGGVGGEGAFDSTKMFRSCGKMVAQDRGDTTVSIDGSTVLT